MEFCIFRPWLSKLSFIDFELVFTKFDLHVSALLNICNRLITIQKNSNSLSLDGINDYVFLNQARKNFPMQSKKINEYALVSWEN